MEESMTIKRLPRFIAAGLMVGERKVLVNTKDN